MAARILSVNFIKSFNNLKITSCNSFLNVNKLTENTFPYLTSIRNTSFFNKLPADDLWKGVTSVSNAGKKRGRGKGVGRRIAKDLNKGQMIGVGRSNIVWPGLNSPIIRGRELIQQQKLPEDPDRDAKLRKIRDEMGNFRIMRINPIDRGWTGSRMPGRSIGPPDAIGEDKFEGFDTRVIELKTVFIMKGNLGRKRRLSCFVVCGNGNGLAGFALGKAVETKAAIRKAKNRAAQKLMHIDLSNNHTVLHDFFCQFGATKIYVQKKPEGYGLVCHRAIKTICHVLGIKDIYAKVEGSTNVQHVVKTFFIGLLQQKSHQQLAEEKQLHLVELHKEHDEFPKVVASPAVCRTANDIKRDEIMDFNQYVMGGKLLLHKKKFPPFYTKFRSWDIYRRKQERIRNHDKIRMHMLTHQGELKSFHTAKYPECRPKKNTPAIQEAAE